MLILSRREGESIILNPGQPNQVEIVVVSRKKGRLQIGIAAPKEVVIVRREILHLPAKGKDVRK